MGADVSRTDAAGETPGQMDPEFVLNIGYAEEGVIPVPDGRVGGKSVKYGSCSTIKLFP